MFRTEFNIKKIDCKITTKSKILFFGSCFTENIGRNISDLYLTNIINPFGVLYNPASISENLRILISNNKFEEKDLIYFNNKWLSYNHHGKFSNQDKSVCLENINNEIYKSNKILKSAGFLFITFGTAWVYKLKDKSNKIVANCHKFPAANFVRERLDISEIIKDYSLLIEEIKNINPNINIVFTVSPIRHWKDGANGNQLSKSVLLLAIEKIVAENKNTFYFPSYEIMMDDLRDYRFYSSDMFHINEIAINYIWDKFKACFFKKSLFDFEKNIIKINKSLNHKTADNNSTEYSKFIKDNISKVEKLEAQFNIDLSELKENFLLKINF
jgi:hypothetical protein